MPADIKTLSSIIENDYGHVDVLFNNAGIILDSKELNDYLLKNVKETHIYDMIPKLSNDIIDNINKL